jgi:hypothetical protein
VVSNTYYCVVFLFVFVLCLVYPMLPVSLDCSFLNVPSVFSNGVHLDMTSKQEVLSDVRGAQRINQLLLIRLMLSMTNLPLVSLAYLIGCLPYQKSQSKM